MRAFIWMITLYNLIHKPKSYLLLKTRDLTAWVVEFWRGNARTTSFLPAYDKITLNRLLGVINQPQRSDLSNFFFILSHKMQHAITAYFICCLGYSCLCYQEELEQPWWSTSLHAVHHLHLTPPELEAQKIEIEVIKSERSRPSQSSGAGKEPHRSIVIKG